MEESSAAPPASPDLDLDLVPNNPPPAAEPNFAASVVDALSFDRSRLLRSAAVGALLQAPIYHYYYEITEALLPTEEHQYNAILKILLDQTVTIAAWNAIYYAFLGVLEGDEPRAIFKKIRETAWPLMKAGWRLWPAAHIITYGVIPVQHRLLWVDIVEVAWVVVLSLTGNASHGSAEEAEAAEKAADR